MGEHNHLEVSQFNKQKINKVKSLGIVANNELHLEGYFAVNNNIVKLINRKLHSHE